MELKTVKRIIVIWIILLLAIAVAGALLESKVLIIVTVVFAFLNMVFQFIFLRCPYCGKVPFRAGDRYAKCCQYCGKKVLDD